MAADFGRIETCGCCGKDVKRPVFNKRLNVHLGKDCAEAIALVRRNLWMVGEEKALTEAQSYWPRTWQRIVELAR